MLTDEKKVEAGSKDLLGCIEITTGDETHYDPEAKLQSSQ